MMKTGEKVIKSGDFCKFKASAMYDVLVNDFGFDKAAAKAFGLHGTLAAPAVSPEGWDCIFFSRSNWVKGDSNGIWENTIMGDWKTIEEKYIGEGKCPDKSCNTRIVFAKNERNYDGSYIFLGVYDTWFDEETRTRIYNRVSDTYSKKAAAADLQEAA